MRNIGLVLLALLAFSVASSCSQATRRSADGDADGDVDGDGDGDGDGDTCDIPDLCDGATTGFERTSNFSMTAEVVAVESGKVTLLGADGSAMAFHSCGLDLSERMTAGEVLEVTQSGSPNCRQGELRRGSDLIALAYSCRSDDTEVPTFSGPGWVTDATMGCHESTRRSCFGSEELYRVSHDYWDLTVTTADGEETSCPLGVATRVGGWTILPTVAETMADMEIGCPALIWGRLSLVAMSDPPEEPDCPTSGVDPESLGFGAAWPPEGELFTVTATYAASIELEGSEGTLLTYGWFGPDPVEALTVGDVVQVYRLIWNDTEDIWVDVIERDDEAVLLVVGEEGDELVMPDLEDFGLSVELGDACPLEEDWHDCSEDPVFAQSHTLMAAEESGPFVEISNGTTRPVGAWEVTAVVATEHPDVVCDDGSTEPGWAELAFTAMLAE